MKTRLKEELRKNGYELIALTFIGFVIGTSFHLFGKPVSADSALTFLSSIAGISAGILSVFSAVALFLMERSPIARRKVMHKGDFISAFILFTLAILHSLAGILAIEPDTSVDLRTLNGDLLLFLPLMWMISAIVIVGFFIWKLSLDEAQQS